MLRKICFLMLAASSVFAGSIKLINDSGYTLKVIISDGKGPFTGDTEPLGQLTLKAGESRYWSDLWGERGYQGNIQKENKNPNYSASPYRILWLCMNGTEFAVCDNVHSDNFVTARSCPGGQICKPATE